MQRSGSSSTDWRAQATHLVVFQHGLWGNEKDFRNFQTLFQQYFPQDEIYTHVAQSNATSLSSIFQTYDGIDIGGARLADEVQAIATKMPQLAKFSIAGHSLGGLYARYCIGVLFARGFFENVEPMNFITLASPHMGIRRTQKSAPWNALFNAVAPNFFDLTGQQFTLTDTASEQTLALSRSVRKYKHRKRFTVYTEMEGELSVRVATTSSAHPESEENATFTSTQCTLDSDGFLRLYPQPAPSSPVSGSGTSSVPEVSSPASEGSSPASKVSPPVSEVSAEEGSSGTPENDETLAAALAVEIASTEPVTTETTTKACIAEIDLVDAHITVVLPEKDDATGRRRSFSRRKSSSFNSIQSDTSYWEIEIESPGFAVDATDQRTTSTTMVTIRIPYAELSSQWKWVAALSNASHGVHCRSQTAPHDGPPPPSLLSCLTRGQFLQALQLFRARALYASVFNDLQVPYSCGSIRAFNPYRVETEPADQARSPYYHHVIMRSLWNAPLLRDTLPEDVAARAERSSSLSRVSLVKSLGERNHTRSRHGRPESSRQGSFSMSFSKFLSSQSSAEPVSSRPAPEILSTEPTGPSEPPEATIAPPRPPPLSQPVSSSSSASSSWSSSFFQRRLDGTPQAPSNTGSVITVTSMVKDAAEKIPTTDPKETPSSSSLASFFSGSSCSVRDPKRLPPFEDGSLLLDHADQAFCHDALRDDLRGMMLSLQSVGWRRIDVLFHSPLAHMKIIAMTANPTKPVTKGLDVVHHVMDTFLL